LAGSVRQLCGAIDTAEDQAPGIEKVLRLKVSRGPLATGIEFNAQEISNLAVHTIPNFADKLAFGVADAKVGLQRDRLVELKTGSGKRDVFQIGHTFANAPGLVLPLDIHHIRTQHPWLYAPVEHTLLIGEREGNDYEGYATKIALTHRKALIARSVSTEYHAPSRSTRILVKISRTAMVLSLTGL
jgi:hypothetical protein